MKTHILVPVSREIQPRTTRFLLALAGTGLIGGYNDLEGCAWVHHARVELQGLFLEGRCDAALFVDADVACAEGGEILKAMVAIDQPIVTATYVKRTTGDLAIAFTDSPAHIQTVGAHRVVPVSYTGLGCTFIRRDAFERVAPLSPQHKSIRTGKIVRNPFYSFIDPKTFESKDDDSAFFARACDAGLNPLAVVDFTLIHDGVASRLADLKGLT